MLSEWLHGDFLQQVERQLLSWVRQSGHLEGETALVADARLAGIAHDGGEVLGLYDFMGIPLRLRERSLRDARRSVWYRGGR
jgi:hypothetical protein